MYHTFEAVAGVGAWAAFTTITWGCAGAWTTFHSAGRQHVSREASVITVNLVARQITSSATSAPQIGQRSVSCASIPMATKEPMNDTAVSDTCAFAMHLPELARQQHAPAVILDPMSAQTAKPSPATTRLKLKGLVGRLQRRRPRWPRSERASIFR